jgi:hypothetical protein
VIETVRAKTSKQRPGILSWARLARPPENVFLGLDSQEIGVRNAYICNSE